MYLKNFNRFTNKIYTNVAKNISYLKFIILKSLSRLLFMDFFSWPSFKNKYARGVVEISCRPVLWDTSTNRASFKHSPYSTYSNLFMVCCWRPPASVSIPHAASFKQCLLFFSLTEAFLQFGVLWTWTTDCHAFCVISWWNFHPFFNA